MIWGLLRQIGNAVVVPPALTGDAKPVGRYDEFDVEAIRRLALKAENQNRAAILLAVIEGMEEL